MHIQLSLKFTRQHIKNLNKLKLNRCVYLEIILKYFYQFYGRNQRVTLILYRIFFIQES